MSKKKELENLEAILNHENYYKIHQEEIWDRRNKRIAKIIQNDGYTKTHFPIEKLEEWLGKLKGDWEHQEKQDHIEKALCEMIINTLQAVEDKIQELKGDIEEEG